MLNRKFWPILLVVVLLVLGGTVYSMFFSARQAERDVVRLATGPEDGIYSAFGEAFAATSDINVTIVATQGTAQNLQMLRDGEVDFAVVQGDMAEYTASGLRGQALFEDYAYVAALFPEYVQVLLPADSTVSVLGDLRGTSICVGQPGSGTYFNAIDVLGEAGLRAGIDFFPVNLPVNDCIEQMVNPPEPEVAEEAEADEAQAGAADDDGMGEAEVVEEEQPLGAGPIAATFATSSRLLARGRTDLRQIPLNDTINTTLVNQANLYRMAEPAEGGAAQLAVQAYLLTNINQPSSTVERVTTALLDNWETIRAVLPGSPEFDAREEQGVIPYHAAARANLEDAGVLQGTDVLMVAAIVLWIAGFFASVYWVVLRPLYNRLGEVTERPRLQRYLLRVVTLVANVLVAVTIIVLLIGASLWALLLIEDADAVRRGGLSPFAQFNIIDSFVWMLTYIGSGFTADNVYPVSVPGKVIVALLAILGVATPLAYMVKLMHEGSNKKQRKLEGREDCNFENHTLVCGWNEKAEGIIYTLTGRNVLDSDKVVIVADRADEYPVEQAKFHRGRVAYVRGDPSDTDVLTRANVGKAKAAIVLADFDAMNQRNRAGIHTVMNIRSMNPDAHICAELEFLDNADYFRHGGCNALIYDRMVAIRLATTAIISPHLVDYVFDCVTYRGRRNDKLFAIPAGEVMQALGTSEISVADLRRDRILAEVNVVGVLDRPLREGMLFSAFTLDENGHTIVDADYRRRKLSPDATIVYSALRRDKIKVKGTHTVPEPVDSPEFRIRQKKTLSICAVSGKATLEELHAQLHAYFGEGLEFYGVDLDEGGPKIDRIAEELPDHVDCCMILQTTEGRSNHSSMKEVNAADSDQILRTRLFCDVRDKWEARHGKEGEQPAWPIYTEICNRKNRRVAREAGADHVLLCSMLAERLIAKEVHDKSHVTDFLLAAMNLEDAVHLHAHVVEEGDGFCGHEWQRLLTTLIEGARVLGWRAAKATHLRNVEGDYGWHYRTVIDQRMTQNLVASPGDIVILLKRHRDRHENASVKIEDGREDEIADVV